MPPTTAALDDFWKRNRYALRRANLELLKPEANIQVPVAAAFLKQRKRVLRSRLTELNVKAVFAVPFRLFLFSNIEEVLSIDWAASEALNNSQ